MTEGTPLTPEELRQMNRNLMEKVLDRAATDAEWKQRLLDDPEVAGHVQLVDYVPPLSDYQLGPLSSFGLRFLNA